jgi:hypothetical protein
MMCKQTVTFGVILAIAYQNAFTANAAFIISRSRNNLKKPENRGAFPFGCPHPYFRGSFGQWFAFREVLIIAARVKRCHYQQNRLGPAG